MFRVIEAGEYLKGRGIDAKVTISLVMSMRKSKRKPDVNQILQYARTTKEEVSTCYKKLKKIPDLFPDTRIMPADIVAAKADKLGLHYAVKEAAIQIAKNFVQNSVEEGKKPATIAGVSIFMAMSKLRNRSTDTESTWKAISEIVGISV